MFLRSKVQPVRGADNLTAIYEPIVLRMWPPRPVLFVKNKLNIRLYYTEKCSRIFLIQIVKCCWDLRFSQVLTMKNVVSPDMVPCSLVGVRVGLKMKTTRSSKTSVNIFPITQHLASKCHNLSNLAVLPLLYSISPTRTYAPLVEKLCPVELITVGCCPYYIATLHLLVCW
jgi:hypothetical protein